MNIIIHFYYMFTSFQGQRRFDVIIYTPPYIFDTDWGIAGTLEGE